MDLLDLTDELGPLKILHIHEPSVGLRAIVVVDNVACGPSIGGVRMAPDVCVEEACRLARAMTLKNSAAGLAHGGGKSVIFADPKMEPAAKEQLIRAFACAIKDLHDYIPGPDMGTDELCMAWMHDEIGRAVGLPREIGGIPLDEIGATGYGLSHCVDVALEFCNFELAGAKVVVQGFGSVGKNVARFLVEKGAVLVGVADSGGAVFNPKGLDVDHLFDLKKMGKGVTEYEDAKHFTSQEIIAFACDIFIPAARPDVIHLDNVNQLKARLVVSGANIPFSDEIAEILHKRGVLVIPDYIANAGGVICAAAEYHGGSQLAAFQEISEKIRCNTTAVLAAMQEKNILPRQAADELAASRLHRAMATKRWNLF
ncbi:MAG: Glu/Leu/Phe/Val dehydrogenase [Proteobacteria bacterium]|nr:Glu/Leu/Phe/Val dehydrogenase [Pseudomonadota bacterium]MBU1639906.1 Glu/Leu/Phe/Val dehydrogenase [Pseudomonadota bacterium]